MQRRSLIVGFGALAGAVFSSAAIAAGPARLRPFTPPSGPRARVVFINDLAGDIDGLFAALHALLSPSIQITALIGTGTGTETAEQSTQVGNEIVDLLGLSGRV